MATTTQPVAPNNQLLEMAWDPITRIVGSLGIYTKFDWADLCANRCKKRMFKHASSE